MIKRTHIKDSATAVGTADTALSEIWADDLRLALSYLAECEFGGSLVFEKCEHLDGYISVSADLTAQLFKLLLSSAHGRAPLALSLCKRGENIEILADFTGGYELSTSDAARIARLAYLAGFDATFHDCGFTFSVKVKREAHYAIYALSDSRLLGAFKLAFGEQYRQ